MSRWKVVSRPPEPPRQTATTQAVDPESETAPVGAVLVGAHTVEGPVEWTSLGSIKGPKGDTGTSGPPGGEYVHRQNAPASTWTVMHNLGARPDIVLFLDSNPAERVWTDVSYPDDNVAVVEFPQPETGWAYAR